MSLLSTKPWVLGILAVSVTLLSACHSPARQPKSQPTIAPPETQALNTPNQIVLGDGLYEMAYFPSQTALYVASAQNFKRDNGGVLYKVDAHSLAITGITHTDLKNFGMASQPNNPFFYTTNSLDGTLSKVEVSSGKIVQRLQLSKKNSKGEVAGAREILWHGNELYIGAVANPGYISVVDTNTFTVKTRITKAGKWVTGLLYSPSTDRIYEANGSGEILVINPHNHRIEKRWTSGETTTNLFLNFAEDPATGRLFVTDSSQGKATYVFDEHSGKVLKKIPGESLAVKFNAKRNELYITQREAHQVLRIDAATYEVKQRWHFTASPNSLLLTEDGNTLYVTIKQALEKDYAPKGPDSLVRITL